MFVAADSISCSQVGFSIESLAESGNGHWIVTRSVRLIGTVLVVQCAKDDEHFILPCNRSHG